MAVLSGGVDTTGVVDFVEDVFAEFGLPGEVATGAFDVVLVEESAVEPDGGVEGGALGDQQVGEFAATAASPFSFRAPLPDTHRGLLFLQIEAEPHVSVREIRIEPAIGQRRSE